VHGAVVDLFGRRIVFEKSGSDVIGFARVGEREHRARAGNHAVALILAVRGVADFLGEGVIGVLQRAHHGCVDADVQSFQAIKVARRIEKAVESLGVGAIGGGEADNGAVGRCDDRRSIGGIVEQGGSATLEQGVEFLCELIALLRTR